MVEKLSIAREAQGPDVKLTSLPC